MASEAEIAWAAGLFEGEGCACVSVNRGRVISLLKLAMVDRGPVEQFHAIVGAGTTRFHAPPSRDGKKPLWYWSANAKADVEHVADLLIPHVFERRRKALEAAREVARRVPGGGAGVAQ